MMGFFTALTEHGFLQLAAIAGLLASVACGVMGTYVVVKRITFLAGGIAHSVLGGMGAAVYFGFDPLFGALIAAVVAALLIGWIRILWDTQEDTLIGALWAVGMATGIIFISRSPGYQQDLMSYLFGNILLVSEQSLWLMLLLDAIILIIVAAWNRQFLAVVFDPEHARLSGVPVTFFYLLLLVLVAITVVLLIQVVGLILVLALLSLPAAIAGLYVRSLTQIMLLATALGCLITFTGLAVSYEANLPAGATIIMVAGALYGVSALFSNWLKRKRLRISISKQ